MQYRYVGTDNRAYPYARVAGGTTCLMVKPGDLVDLDEAPNDGRWEEAPPKAEPAKTTAAKTAPKEA